MGSSGDNIEEYILPEIKGLLVDIYGNPNRELKSKNQLDKLIDDIGKIIRDWWE